MSRLKLHSAELWDYGIFFPLLWINMVFEDQETHHYIHATAPARFVLPEDQVEDYDAWANHFHQQIEDTKSLIEREGA